MVKEYVFTGQKAALIPMQTTFIVKVLSKKLVDDVK